MAKTVTWKNLLAWANKKKIYPIVALPLLIFGYLISSGAITVLDYSGDMVCDGTPQDLCKAYISFRANDNISITKSVNWSNFYTDKPIKNLKMYINSSQGWREINLSKACTGEWCGGKSSSALSFKKGKTYAVLFTAEKYKPSDIIEWSFGFNSGAVPNAIERDFIDPKWLSEEAILKNFSEIKSFYSEDYTPKCNISIEGYSCRQSIEVGSLIGFEPKIRVINMLTNESEMIEYYKSPIYGSESYKDNCTSIDYVQKLRDCNEIEIKNGTKECFDYVEEKKTYECDKTRQVVSSYELKGKSKVGVDIKILQDGASLNSDKISVSGLGTKKITLLGNIPKGSKFDIQYGDGTYWDKRYALWQNPSSALGWTVTNPSGGSASYTYSVDVPLWNCANNFSQITCNEIISNYHFEDAATDTTGRYNLSGANTTYVDGKFLKAYDSLGGYDGDTGINPATVGGLSWTINFWVNQSSDGTDEYFMGLDNAGGASTLAWYILLDNSTRMVLNLYGATTTGIDCDGKGLEADEWHMVTVKLVSGASQMYVDGVSCATASTTTWTGMKSQNIALFAYEDGVTTNNYDGNIDEVSIWNRPLTDAEILRLYSEGIVYDNQIYTSTFENASNYLSVYDGTSELNWEFLEFNPINQKEKATGDAYSHYRFNTSSGSNTTWTPDEVGLYNLTVSGADSSDSLPNLGESYYFDGASDYLTGTHANIATNNGTLSAWVKTTDTAGCIVQIDGSASDPQSQVSLGLVASGSNGIPQIQINRVSGSQRNTKGTINIADGKWHYVVGMKTGNNAYAIYVDGVSDTLTNTDYGSVTDTWWDDFTTNRIRVGNCYAGYLSGYIDEVRIYNRPLTATEIQQSLDFDSIHFWNSNLSVNVTSIEDTSSWKLNDSGMVLNYDFSEGAGTTLYDKERVGDTVQNGAITAGAGSWITNTPQAQIPYAYKFDGSATTVSAGNVLPFVTGDSITIMAWVQPNTLANQEYIAKKYNYDFGVLEGNLTMSYYNIVGGDQVYKGNESILTRGSWQHIATTYTFGTGSTMKLYVNGALINGYWRYGNGNTNPPSNTNVLSISPTSGYLGTYANANITKVKIFNRSLSASEISALYDAEKNGLIAEVSGEYSHPTLTAVDITPDPAYVNDTLTCTPTGTADSYLYNWYKDGTIVSAETTNTLVLDSTYAHLNVTCKVTPYTAGNGTAMNDSIILSNTAPIAENVSISPDPAYTNDTLACDYDFADLDGDSDQSYIDWYVNGRLIYQKQSPVGWCYQETFNVSTACGGLATGSFSETYYNVSAPVNTYKFYDGLWGVANGYEAFGSTDYDALVYHYVNYTKPPGVVSANVTWNVYDFGAPSDTINRALPDDCILSTIQIRHELYKTLPYNVNSTVACWNEVSWETVYNYYSTSAVGQIRFMEEAMWWNISEFSLDSSYFNATDNVSCNVTPYDGYDNGTMASNETTIWPNFELAIEDYTTAKKWEMFTTPEILCRTYDIDTGVNYSDNVCISIDLKDYGTNYSCGASPWKYNFTIPYVELDKFNGSLSAVNLTENDTDYIRLKDWYEYVNMSFDAYAYNSTTDAKIYIPNSSSLEFEFRGDLLASTLTEDRFSDNTSSATYDLQTSSYDTNNILVSTAGTFATNFTMTINATEANPQSLDYRAEWINESDFNGTGASEDGDFPIFMFDDIQTAVTGRWNYDTSGGGSAGFEVANDRMYSTTSASETCPDGSSPCSRSSSENSWVNTKELYLEGKKRVDIGFSMSIGTSRCCSSNPGDGSGYGILYINNEETGSSGRVTLYTCEGDSSSIGTRFYGDCTSNPSGYLTLQKEGSTTSWKVYYNGVYLRTVSIPTGNVNLVSYSQASASCTVYHCSGVGGSGSASSTVYINYIKYGGFGNNYSDTTDSYSTGVFTAISSILLNSSPDDTTSIYSTFEESQPSGCDARVYATADDSANWQELTDESTLTFTNVGDIIRYKIWLNASSTDNLTPCAVYDVELDIISDYPENLSIYFGSSLADADYVGTIELNDTSTPLDITVNTTQLQDYVDSECDDDTTCSVPMIFTIADSSAGQLIAWNLSLPQTIDDLPINGSILNSYVTNECATEDCDMPISTIQTSDSIIEFKDLVIRYYGSGNISINCTMNDSVSSALDMIIRYSPFYLDFTTSTLEYLEFYAYTKNAKNVSPYGQIVSSYKNKSIFNFTSNTYDHKIDLYALSNQSLNASKYNFTVTEATYNDKFLVLNSSAQPLLYNKTNTTSSYLYMFLDLYNASSYPSLEWYNDFVSYCSDEGDSYGACVVVD